MNTNTIGINQLIEFLELKKEKDQAVVIVEIIEFLQQLNSENNKFKFSSSDEFNIKDIEKFIDLLKLEKLIFEKMTVLEFIGFLKDLEVRGSYIINLDAEENIDATMKNIAESMDQLATLLKQKDENDMNFSDAEIEMEEEVVTIYQASNEVCTIVHAVKDEFKNEDLAGKVSRLFIEIDQKTYFERVVQFERFLGLCVDRSFMQKSQDQRLQLLNEILENPNQMKQILDNAQTSRHLFFEYINRSGNNKISATLNF